jgi:putative cell wall-binding protein
MALAVALSLTALIVLPVRADEDRVTRIFGEDRILTAIGISQDDFPEPGSVTSVVLATSLNFPDAVAATPLAKDRKAPVLLTTPSQLHPSTEEEIRRILVYGGTVYLLGGTEAVTNDVSNRLTAMDYIVVRLAGRERSETALRVAEQLGPIQAIFVAEGGAFPAALVAGVAAAEVRGAVLLTNGHGINPETQEFIDKHRDLPRYAVGAWAAEVDPSAIPIAGADRYEDARLVAERFFPTPAAASVVNGERFPDALTGGPHAARRQGPLLLTEPSSLNAQTRQYLSQRSGSINLAHIYGGTAVVTTEVEQQVLATISGG